MFYNRGEVISDQFRGDWIPQNGCFFGKLPNNPVFADFSPRINGPRPKIKLPLNDQIRMILVCQKLLGQITKVLGFRRNPPHPPYGKKLPNNPVFFFERLPNTYLTFSKQILKALNSTWFVRYIHLLQEPVNFGLPPKAFWRKYDVKLCIYQLVWSPANIGQTFSSPILCIGTFFMVQ